MENKLLIKANNLFNKTKFQVKKHSPEILLATGIVGVITGTVLACKATRKIDDILEDTKADVYTIHETRNNPEFAEKYTEKDAKSDIVKTYAKTGLSIAKLYAPAVLTEGLAIGCILASYDILKKRNIALAASLTAVTNSFNEYRKRVAEKYGEEAENAIRYDIKAKKIEEEVTDEEGKTKTVKKTVGVSNLGEFSDYAFYFDRITAPNVFENSMDYNNMYVRGQEQYSDDIRVGRGYLTYGEIIDGFHIKHDCLTEFQKKAMLVAGYVHDKNEDEVNRVKFRATESYRELEDGSIIKTIIIDPNVEGNIYDRIKNI